MVSVDPLYVASLGQVLTREHWEAGKDFTAAPGNSKMLKKLNVKASDIDVGVHKHILEDVKSQSP